MSSLHYIAALEEQNAELKYELSLHWFAHEVIERASADVPDVPIIWRDIAKRMELKYPELDEPTTDQIPIIQYKTLSAEEQDKASEELLASYEPDHGNTLMIHEPEQIYRVGDALVQAVADIGEHWRSIGNGDYVIDGERFTALMSAYGDLIPGSVLFVNIDENGHPRTAVYERSKSQ